MNTLAPSATYTNPFPGLRPFQEGEEHLFFGRESQTDALIDKLRQTRFLAVIGSSGSGKSSLVNCGLLTALRGGIMAEAGTVWRIASCRPSGHPIRSLASALAKPEVLFDTFDNDNVSLDDIIDANLHMSERGIVDVFEHARQKPNVNLLIVVDQFEELFRYTAGKVAGSNEFDKARSEAAEFVKLLLHAQTQTTQPIYIVLTMRSDFLGDCTHFDGLAEAINEGQYLVPRMSRDERRLAISGPVAVGGARIDPVLLTRLINDLGDDPDQLSILQHALNRIWARWSGLGRTEDPLQLVHYHSIGGKLALDTHAEKAFAELPTERAQLLCEKLFKALTDKATDPRGVRRPTSFSKLCDLTGASSSELTQVIDIFRKPSRSFLMPSATQALEPETIVDISHESLMRIWKRLISWTETEAESTKFFQRLASAAALHAKGEASLYRDPELDLALNWRGRNEPNEHWASLICPGFEQAMKFLDDSREANADEIDEALRREARERELEREKVIAQEQQLEAQASAAKKQRQIIWLVVSGLILTSGLLVYAVRLTIEAEGQKKYKEDSIKAIAELYQEANNAKIANLNAKIANLNSIKSVAQKLSDNQKILSVSVNLIAHEQAVTRTFVNQSEKKILLSTLDSEARESELIPLPAGQSIDVEAFVNQIWIARIEKEVDEVKNGKGNKLSELLETAAFNTNDQPINLKP